MEPGLLAKWTKVSSPLNTSVWQNCAATKATLDGMLSTMVSAFVERAGAMKLVSVSSSNWGSKSAGSNGRDASGRSPLKPERCPSRDYG